MTDDIRDKVADAIFEQLDIQFDVMPSVINTAIIADAAIAAYHQARRIETVEQLDALSNYSVVLGHTTAYQLDGDNNLSGLYGPWMPTGSEVPVWSDEIPLPCALLWTPGGGE